MGWDIVCLKTGASFSAHEGFVGEVLTGAESWRSHLYQKLCETWIPESLPHGLTEVLWLRM